MARPNLEVADIFRRHGPRYRSERRLPLSQWKLMKAVETCRTAALGGHVERCGHCQHERIAYNSCRNRHCPKCQNLARARWLARRNQELLPVEYFHVVFTIPQQLHTLCLQNKKVLYGILFRASSEALQKIAGDPKHLGATIGFFSVLHTWGQNLLLHPHVHCVATGGGLLPGGAAWRACRPGFFLSVRVLSRLFRRLFLEALTTAFAKGQLQCLGDLARYAEPAAFAAWLAPLRRVEWVVYAKPPFGGPQQVLDYVGRYTHRVALCNQRLLRLQDDQVTFQYKDYRAPGRLRCKTMTISAAEFIRRFLLHELPSGFQRIRSYGLLANRPKHGLLARCRALLEPDQTLPLPSAPDIDRFAQQLLTTWLLCPRCGIGPMLRVQTLAPVHMDQPPIDSS